MRYLTEQEQVEALISWLYDTTGVTFVKASQDGSRPLTQYGAVYIRDTRERAIPEQTYADVDGDDTKVDETIRMWNEVVFSVEVYRNEEGGNSALDIVRLIELNLRTSTASERLSVEGNLGLVRYSRVRHFYTEVANIMEPRANIDITFNIYQSLTVRIDNIEGVNVEANTIAPDGDTTTNTNLIKRSP